MIASNKKLYFFLLIIIGILSVLVFQQFSIANKNSLSHSDKTLVDTNLTDIPIDPSDPVFGNQGAPITILEFIDLNSQLSRDIYRQTKDFVAAHPTEIRMIWKDLPTANIFNADTSLPHLAAWCAYKQDKNKFWNFIDLALTHKKITDINILTNIADQLKLNINAWQQCIGATETKTKIETSLSLGRSLNILKGPAIFINNKKINYLNEINLEDFLKEIIKTY